MKTTVLIRQLPFNGAAEQKLWHVDPPVKYQDYDTTKETEYVISSATDVPFSGPETYIFPANEKGEVIHWGELSGSYKGGLDHDEAIKNLKDEEEYA